MTHDEMNTLEKIDEQYTADLRRASIVYDGLIKLAWNDRAERILNAEAELAEENDSTARIDGPGISAWDNQSFAEDLK